MSTVSAADSLGQVFALLAGTQQHSQSQAVSANPPAQKSEKWPAIIPTAEIRPAPLGAQDTTATGRLNAFA